MLINLIKFFYSFVFQINKNSKIFKLFINLYAKFHII